MINPFGPMRLARMARIMGMTNHHLKSGSIKLMGRFSMGEAKYEIIEITGNNEHNHNAYCNGFGVSNACLFSFAHAKNAMLVRLSNIQNMSARWRSKGWIAK